MENIQKILKNELYKNKYISKLTKRIILNFLDYGNINSDKTNLLRAIDIISYDKLKNFFNISNKEEIYYSIISKETIEKKVELLFTNSKLLSSWIIKKQASIIIGSYPILSNILNSNNFISTNSGPKIFYIKNKRYVISKVKDENLMINNYLKLKELIKGTKNYKLPKQIAFLKYDNISYMITSWEGKSVEDKLKDGEKVDLENFKKLNINLKLLMLNKGIFWYSLAPRNVILIKEGLLLIDFEKTFYHNELSDERRDYYEMFTEIWFGDTMKINFPKTKLDYYFCKADNFEKEWFFQEKISMENRIYLIKLTQKLESIKKKGKISIYGHSLGQYITDFCDVTTEKNIYKFSEKLNKNELFYFLWFLDKCILVDYNSGYFNDSLSKTHISLVSNLNNIIIGGGKDIFFNILLFSFTKIKKVDLDICQLNGIIMSIIDIIKFINNNGLTIYEGKKIINLKIKSVIKYKIIVKDVIENNKQCNGEIKKYYKNLVTKALNIIGKKEGYFIVLGGSFGHNNMNLLSDLDGYLFSKNHDIDNIKVIQKYTMILKSVGLFLNENLFSIMNQYMKYDLLKEESLKVGEKITFSSKEWTDLSETKTLCILTNSNNFSRDPDLFIKFQIALIEDFLISRSLKQKNLLPINEIFGFNLKYIYGDKQLFNLFRTKQQNINSYYNKKILNSKCFLNELKKHSNQKHFTSISTIKGFYFPIYFLLYYLYYKKIIITLDINCNNNLKNFSGKISKILIREAMKHRVYHYYLYYFNRNNQIDIKYIEMNNEFKNNIFLDFSSIYDILILNKKNYDF